LWSSRGGGGGKKVIETNVILFIIYYGDNIVEPKTRKLIPNPASPEMPMIEILIGMAYNRGILFASRSLKPLWASHTCKTLSASLKRMMRNIKANHGGGRYGRNE